MKKIGLIALIVVLTLGIIGVGYAAWSQVLNISGNVSTGNLAATIGSNGSFTSSVGYATIVDGGSTATDLIVTISNAAPGNVFTIPWKISNTGTIPVNAVASVATVTPTSGADAASGDLVVAGTPGTITNLNSPTQGGTTTVTGSLTITVQSSAPNVVGGCSYTVSVPVTITQ